MNNKELPYMDMRKFRDQQFIICKFADHEKRISGSEYRLKMLEEKGGTHGEWILDAVSPCSIFWLRCSYCGYKYEAYKQSNFCPNCGADMREGEAK